MTTTLTRSSRRVPRAALMFAAAALGEFSTETPDGSVPAPYPITIRARTTGVAYHGFWGRCVHDMAGFIPPTGPVPLDWNHCEDEDIGVADSFTVDAEGLLVAGRLIPFTAEDRAAEIIYKGREGVPYQASVVLDLENLIVTDVPEGSSFEVNGQVFEGPLTVFSQWSIDGVSVLHAGADGSTSLQFSRGDNVEFDVTVQTPAPTKEPPPMVDPAPNTTPPPVLPPNAANFSRDELQRWKTHFGAAGAEWYIDGTHKTFEEAALQFGRNLQTQLTEQKTALEATIADRDKTIAELTTERDQLKAKTEFRRGHQTPAKVDPPADGGNQKPVSDPTNPAHFGRSPGMAAFVNAVAAKLPKSTNS